MEDDFTVQRLYKQNKVLEEQIKQLQAELAELKRLLKSDHYKLQAESRFNDWLIAKAQIKQLQAELEKLKEFARHIIEIECWSLFDQDGGDIQDLAEKLGLIEQHIATEDDINEDISDFEVGDTIYKFSKVLKGE